MGYDLSMNLAFAGFTISGIIFGVYSISLYRMAGVKLPPIFKNYAIAYLGLFFAFLVWGIGSIIPGFLDSSIIFGDVFILASTVLLLSFLFARNRNFNIAVIIIATIISLILIWLRLSQFPPQAFMSDGILIFNTQKFIGIVLSLIFILIWLPANMYAAKLITSTMKAPQMTIIYSFVYAFSTISAILLISFKTAPMVIASFVALSICFVLLLYSNYIISKFTNP